MTRRNAAPSHAPRHHCCKRAGSAGHRCPSSPIACPAMSATASPMPPSAAAVGVVLDARQRRPRAIGLAAAIPINSVPALYWLSVSTGTPPRRPCSAVGHGLTVLLGAGLRAWPGCTGAPGCWRGWPSARWRWRPLRFYRPRSRLPPRLFARSCSDAPRCRACLHATCRSAPTDAAAVCCRWPWPVPCRCWSPSCPATAARSSAGSLPRFRWSPCSPACGVLAWQSRSCCRSCAATPTHGREATFLGAGLRGPRAGRRGWAIALACSACTLLAHTPQRSRIGKQRFGDRATV